MLQKTGRILPEDNLMDEETFRRAQRIYDNLEPEPEPKEEAEAESEDDLNFEGDKNGGSDNRRFGTDVGSCGNFNGMDFGVGDYDES